MPLSRRVTRELAIKGARIERRAAAARLSRQILLQRGLRPGDLEDIHMSSPDWMLLFDLLANPLAALTCRLPQFWRRSACGIIAISAVVPFIVATLVIADLFGVA